MSYRATATATSSSKLEHIRSRRAVAAPNKSVYLTETDWCAAALIRLSQWCVRRVNDPGRDRRQLGSSMPFHVATTIVFYHYVPNDIFWGWYPTVMLGEFACGWSFADTLDMFHSNMVPKR